VSVRGEHSNFRREEVRVKSEVAFFSPGPITGICVRIQREAAMEGPVSRDWRISAISAGAPFPRTAANAVRATAPVLVSLLARPSVSAERQHRRQDASVESAFEAGIRKGGNGSVTMAFVRLSRELVEVNDRICELRPSEALRMKRNWSSLNSAKFRADQEASRDKADSRRGGKTGHLLGLHRRRTEVAQTFG
jgi:hypothetical protein